mgnify:FL=1
MSPVSAASIKTEIENTIKNLEPRAKVDYVTVLEDPDNNAYRVSVQFYIGNNVQPTSISLILERTR